MSHYFVFKYANTTLGRTVALGDTIATNFQQKRYKFCLCSEYAELPVKHLYCSGDSS